MDKKENVVLQDSLVSPVNQALKGLLVSLDHPDSLVIVERLGCVELTESVVVTDSWAFPELPDHVETISLVCLEAQASLENAVWTARLVVLD